MSVLHDEIVQLQNNHLQVERFRDYRPNGMQVMARKGSEHDKSE